MSGDIFFLDNDPDWNCAVHQRGLTYFEWKQGGCFWCDPDKIPAVPMKDGKPLTKSWEARQKVWQEIRALTPEQRQALIPSPLPGSPNATRSSSSNLL